MFFFWLGKETNVYVYRTQWIPLPLYSKVVLNTQTKEASFSYSIPPPSLLFVLTLSLPPSVLSRSIYIYLLPSLPLTSTFKGRRRPPI